MITKTSENNLRQSVEYLSVLVRVAVALAAVGVRRHVHGVPRSRLTVRLGRLVAGVLRVFSAVIVLLLWLLGVASPLLVLGTLVLAVARLFVFGALMLAIPRLFIALVATIVLLAMAFVSTVASLLSIALVVAHPVAHAVHAAPVVAHAVHAAPAYHAPVKAGYVADDLAEQSPYTFTYAVADDYSKSSFNAEESSDGASNVQGSYSVALPDGRIQHVTYTSNGYDGFVADVTYEGTAVYPEEKPYVPAPAPAYHA